MRPIAVNDSGEEVKEPFPFMCVRLCKRRLGKNVRTAWFEIAHDNNLSMPKLREPGTTKVAVDQVKFILGAVEDVKRQVDNEPEVVFLLARAVVSQF